MTPGGRASRSNDELLLDSSRGDIEAYRELFEANSGKLYNFVYYLTYSKEDAEDITSDTFIRVFEAIQDRDVSSFNLQAYLYKTARNLSYNAVARRKREGLTLEEAAEVPQLDVAADPETSALIGEQRTSVRHVTELLTEEQQTALLLKELEGLRYDTIAEVMDSNTNAVGALLSRARLKFKEVYRMAQVDTKGIADTCAALVPLMSKYIDDEATPQEIQSLGEHLAACPICNSNLESMKEASVTYRSLIPFLPLASLKLWSSTAAALSGGKAAAAGAHAGGAAEGATTSAQAGTGAAAGTGAGASTVPAAATTSAAGKVGAVLWGSTVARVVTIAAALVIAASAGFGFYLGARALTGTTRVVPSVMGLSEGAAERVAARAGLKFEAEYAVSDHSGKERVIRQSPTPGTRVKKDSQLNATLAERGTVTALKEGDDGVPAGNPSTPAGSKASQTDEPAQPQSSQPVQNTQPTQTGRTTQPTAPTQPTVPTQPATPTQPVERNTPEEAIAEYLQSQGDSIDEYDLIESRTSESDPVWAIYKYARVYHGQQTVTFLFLLHNVDGLWGVLATGNDGNPPQSLEPQAYGAPGDLASP